MSITVTATRLAEVKIVTPKVFVDDRGWFMENWRSEHYHAAGILAEFVQTNSSHSTQGVVRGLHYQWPHPQGKLVWVSHGTVFDVAVDIRPDSDQYGEWVGVELTATGHEQLWIPPGFAHGFQVLSESATFHYQCTSPYRPECDRGIAFNDSDIGVQWPLRPSGVSTKDAQAPMLAQLRPEDLPTCESC